MDLVKMWIGATSTKLGLKASTGLHGVIVTTISAKHYPKEGVAIPSKSIIALTNADK
jgi:hypothetical protein